MRSFSSLNSRTLTYTDNRSPDVITDYGTAFDIDANETTNTFLMKRTIEIEEIIKPNDANLVITIDTTIISGVLIEWSSLPAGVTVSNISGLYVINGVKTVSDWDAVKEPTITVPDGFQGTFFYDVRLEWTTPTGQKFREYRVGEYLPVGFLDSEFTSDFDVNVIRDITKILLTNFEFEAELPAVRDAEANLTSSASLILAPDYLVGYASLQAGTFALEASAVTLLSYSSSVQSTFTDEIAINYIPFFALTEFGSQFTIPVNNGGLLRSPGLLQYNSAFTQPDIDTLNSRIRFGVIEAIAQITQTADPEKFFGLIDEYNGVFTQQTDTLESRIRNVGEVDCPLTASMTVDITESPMTLRVEVEDGEGIYFYLYHPTETFDINWGDGTSSLNVLENSTPSYSSGSSTNRLSHTYSSAGTYLVEIECAQSFHFYIPSQRITAVQSFPYVQLNTLEHMFESGSDIVSIPDHPFTIVPSGVSAQEMFAGCQKFNSPLTNFPAHKVTNMSGMLRNCNDFNQDISNWDVSNVTSMDVMFFQSVDFNQPLNSWNVSNVTNMQSMFETSTSFNQPLNSWNTSSVTNMDRMFANAGVFDQDISSWCVELIPTKPTEFDLNTSVNWTTAEKPNWGAPC